MTKTFPARYDGRCVECDDDIYEGDIIAMTDAGAVHEDCAPTEGGTVITFPL